MIPTCSRFLRRALQRKLPGNFLVCAPPRMTAQNNSRARRTIRALFIIIALFAILLAVAAQHRNAVWWVLKLGSFYLPFFVLCLYVTRKWVLIGSVVVLHTTIVLLLPVVDLLVFGVV